MPVPLRAAAHARGVEHSGDCTWPTAAAAVGQGEGVAGHEVDDRRGPAFVLLGYRCATRRRPMASCPDAVDTTASVGRSNAKTHRRDGGPAGSGGVPCQTAAVQADPGRLACSATNGTVAGAAAHARLHTPAMVCYDTSDAAVD